MRIKTAFCPWCDRRYPVADGTCGESACVHRAAKSAAEGDGDSRQNLEVLAVLAQNSLRRHQCGGGFRVIRDTRGLS